MGSYFSSSSTKVDTAKMPERKNACEVTFDGKKSPSCKICCACPAQRRARDECLMSKDYDQCQEELNAFYQCLLKEGFSESEVNSLKRNARRESKLSEMETKSLYKSRASWDKESIIVFPEHPELLACDPANSIWVYGVYEYKYGVQDTKATRQLAQLVDEVMLCAFRLYEHDANSFWELSPAERDALVLREVIKHDSTFRPSTLSRSNSISNKRLSIESPHRLSRVSLHSECSVNGAFHEQGKAECNNYTSPSSPNKKWSRIDHVNNNTSVTRSENQYNSVLHELLQHWPANNVNTNGNNNESEHERAYCRVKVCVDMIASRKSLQEMPTKSVPYLVGENVYRYLFANYSHHVIHATVGISDAKVKLTCRDVLFPFKRIVSLSQLSSDYISSARAPNSAKADRYKAKRKVQCDMFSATTTTIKHREIERQDNVFTVERSNRPRTGNASSANTNFESSQYNNRCSDVNSLVYIRQPPIAAHEAIDQRRLLVCFCPLLLSS